MAETFLYLTTTGRRSGLPRTIEIWFVEREGRYYVVAENRERAQWVKNLRRDPRARISVGKRRERAESLAETEAVARALDRPEDAALRSEVAARMDAKYGWSEGLVVELAPVG